MRAIVSAIGSPAYNLSKELARILSPLAGHTSLFVKNSTHFVEKIQDTTLDDTDRLISFDVTSLFMKVPLDEAMDAITEKLMNDESLDERTTLSAGEICRLTNLCLRSTYFQFGDAFYEQLEGAVVGSPLSPVVANLYMEIFEERALRPATLQPKMWVRYVDDTFVIWPHGTEELNRFHDHLNDQHPAIQFTREKEAEKRIQFLDSLMERKRSRMKTLVYRKPTNSDQYIHYSSHHQRRVLRGTLYSMRDKGTQPLPRTQLWRMN